MPDLLASDLARLERNSARFAKELTGEGMARRMKVIGREASKDALEAARQTPVRHGTLQDLSMSGWHRGHPVVLATRETLRTGETMTMLITPDRTAGLWRVLTSGRKAYAMGDRRVRGTSRTGTVRRSRVTRTVGATKGFGTWDAAIEKMARRSPIRMRIEMGKAFRDSFRGG